MRITLFEKEGQLCYSTSQLSGTTSPNEESLIAKGWRYVGNFWGWNIQGSRQIPTMSKILTQG